MAIPNHCSPPLSALDLVIAASVPPGGNWKHVPHSIPSRRLEQIRASYAQGKGSRSTYYGRLAPDKPAYTINTYFSRPGNGCHLHYDYAGGQHRVLSQREAARLQSFPDSFHFYGARRCIDKQIGNAVPPLLAYQIATQFSCEGGGSCVDLFCGAGGLSLGFRWAGWQPITANDIDPAAVKTYCHNVHREVVAGDIRNPEVRRSLIEEVTRTRHRYKGPLLVLGGPPCQGFSTAGNRRTMSDERNHLFFSYGDFLETVQPDGFVFENVPGILNMDGGRVFELIRHALSRYVDTLQVWVLRSEEHAIPQRRRRVFLIGLRKGVSIQPLTPITRLQSSFRTLFPDDLPTAVSVTEALGDLPPLTAGQDGSELDYAAAPQNTYQSLMRGFMSPKAFLTGYSRKL